MSIASCFWKQHDPVLLLSAGLICIVSSLTAMDLIHHAKTNGPRLRRAWLGVAGIAGGCGIWATHFIAMMAFASVLPTGYDVVLTTASLLIVVSMTAVGLLVALTATSRVRPWVGGGIVGLGMASMHQVGLAAFRTSGALEYDLGLMAISMLIGIPLTSWAVTMKVRGRGRFVRVRSAALLVLAICALHFISMSGVTIRPDPLIAVPTTALSRHLLALLVGGTGLGVLALAGLALFLDNRERLRRDQFDTVLSLANAAVEGIVVYENERIVVVNTSFAMLLGQPAGALVGRRLADVIDVPPVLGMTSERELTGADGEAIPVEMIRHEISMRGRHRWAIAVRDLRARRQAERRIRHLAHHDALTGLPNRASFTARLDQEMERAMRSGGEVGLMFLDLDRFKDVNDSFGHAAGDALLLAIAQGVTGILDSTQMVARLGGDEFAIILPGVANNAMAGRVADRVIETVRDSVVNLPAGGVIGTSIGIAIFPFDATERSVLLNHADLALNRAKAEGRGVYRFFEPDMGRQALERRLVERDLRLAVADDGLGGVDSYLNHSTIAAIVTTAW